MKREIIKENNNKFLGVDILLYAIFVIVGFILLNLDGNEKVDVIECTYTLFFVFGFFSLFAYFINRVEDDYEFLIFGFINICVGSFIMIYSAYPDKGFILADAVLIYSIANVLNKFYHCKILLEKRDLNFFPKISIAFLLLFLGVFVVSSLYTKVQVGSVILGYYFVIFGLFSLLEPLISILTKNVKVQKYILNILAYEKRPVKKEETKEEYAKKVMDIPEVKEEVKEEIKVEEKVEVKEKKKPVKKTTKKATTKKTSTKKSASKKGTTKKKTTKKTTKK